MNRRDVERAAAPSGTDLPSLLDGVAGLRVLVLGEAMLDAYLQGSAGRLSREAPVPIVNLRGRSEAPGGAGNTAVNVRALGGEPILLSAVGPDEMGGRLVDALARAGVAVDHVVRSTDRTTLAKTRVSADSQMIVRFDQGTTDAIDADLEDVLIERLTSLYHRVDAVIVSDYGYGIVTPRVVAALGELQAKIPRCLVVDAKDVRAFRDVRVTAVKPNYGEAVRVLGEREVEDTRLRAQQIGTRGEDLLERTGARIVAVTLDTDGALVFERGRPVHRTYARPASHARAAGAGDTFVSALALALASGATTPSAAELASAAAAVVVARDGTATCSVDDLRAYVAAGDKLAPSVDRFLAAVRFEHAQGRRIVFTNGVFDILHRGHITYLNRAKALGDLLVVAVNSDASVQRLKGPERPINGIEDRMQVLAALSCIDYLVPFEDDTPVDLIREVRPHVYVKGGDYRRGDLPEGDLVESLGGSVQILPFVEDRSTTAVIERVRSSGQPTPGDRPGPPRDVAGREESRDYGRDDGVEARR